jgi:7-cyano-7-deazaguanine reductase
MRKENHFHEEICECIYKRLWDLLQPEELIVACLYSRRGGIDINPVRASDWGLAYEYAPIINHYSLCTKTTKQ